MKFTGFKKDCTDDVNDLYCFMNCIFINSGERISKGDYSIPILSQLSSTKLAMIHECNVEIDVEKCQKNVKIQFQNFLNILKNLIKIKLSIICNSRIIFILNLNYIYIFEYKKILQKKIIIWFKYEQL